ncbi:MAG: macro domain-containing protein, partial [Proteobacteria bacterium]|nr:macro domain-containing protein [Pseudomonadota bacterium]
PCRYVLHTVGPIIMRALTKKDCNLLASCYTSCLNLAAENDLHSIAFCCISTGVFHFPPEDAARIAFKAVMDWKQNHSSSMDVVFNVFSQKDEWIYQSVLAKEEY